MRQLINVMIPMRDGVGLSADIRLPETGERFSVLLMRTPYGNQDFVENERRYVEHGYAVVKQDCRGKYDSDGKFDHFNEASDGADTAAWLRQQPWCDGRIGMYGGSYCGYTQYAAAWEKPSGLLAITPGVMGHDRFLDGFYRSGAFCLDLAIAWGSGVDGRCGQPNVTADWQKILRHLPLSTIDQAAGYNLPWLRKILRHSTHDEYWRNFSITSHAGDIAIPCLHIGGWYDLYSDGVLHNYESAGKPSKVIIGPWTHSCTTASSGNIDYGKDADIDLDLVRLRWLDRWVKGVDNGIDREPPVRIFVMGENVWRDENEWPLARTKHTPIYLCGKNANSLFGEGRLSFAPDYETTVDEYAYNPENPVPSLGGACLQVCNGSHGPTDHRPIERRDDVLVYTSDVLEKPLEVTGYVNAKLFVGSDAPDTDFIARLCDVYPDGRSIIICDGILPARLREGLDKFAPPMKSGEVYEIDLNLAATSNVFLPGHRLRVEVTSSCFPRFARNLNNGEDFATSTEIRLARQKIWHSGKYPSQILLPVIPRQAVKI
jgi:putative CocE/NonD family hydrolase